MATLFGGPGANVLSCVVGRRAADAARAQTPRHRMAGTTVEAWDQQNRQKNAMISRVKVKYFYALYKQIKTVVTPARYL